MPAPLSIVIPTLNAADALPACAASLFEGLETGLIHQLVVSDGGSSDDTLAVARGLGARLVTGAPGRGGQIARGVAEARGAWLLILHADSQLQPGWTGAVSAHLAARAQRAGFFDLRFRASGAAPAIVAGWANLRSHRLGLPYGDQALLIHRDLLARVGGVPDLPLMEDVALARALRGRLSPLGAVVTTSADRYVEGGWLRRGARNLGTLLRYLAGADPHRLAERYRRP